MNSSLKILRIAILMGAVIFVGTLGYHLLLGWDWLDALYFTMITVTTVGFGEIHQLGDSGRVFTIVLMFGSVGIVMYSATTITQLVMEMQFSHIRWRRRMERKIGAAYGHYIICGMGRTGRAVYDTLTQAGRTVVVIEGDQVKVERLKERDVLLVEGDATHDDYLLAAGIHRAKGLVASLGNDATNVYMILSARELNPDINIVSWATTEEAERKIIQAGANHVMSPYLMGGVRLAQLLENPHAMEFLDHAMQGKNENIRLGEFPISVGSPLISNSLKNLGIRRNLGVIVIGIRRKDGRLEFNPSAEAVFAEGDMLIGIGSVQQLEKLRGMI